MLALQHVSPGEAWYVVPLYLSSLLPVQFLFPLWRGEERKRMEAAKSAAEAHASAAEAWKKTEEALTELVARDRFLLEMAAALQDEAVAGKVLQLLGKKR